MSFDFMHQPGPCVICGDTNYSLSCGGPTICPKCDCGHFDAATVEKQTKVIAGLREELSRSGRALQFVRVLASTPPDEWLSKKEIHEGLAEFRYSTLPPSHQSTEGKTHGNL